MTDTEISVEHKVVDAEVLNYLTGSERLTCACGWQGHRNYWNNHGRDVPPLKHTQGASISRDVLRKAVYGDRPRDYR